MSRVISLHETILHPNVTEEEFERFLREELPSAMAEYTDTKMYVLKGIEGDGKIGHSAVQRCLEEFQFSAAPDKAVAACQRQAVLQTSRHSAPYRLIGFQAALNRRQQRREDFLPWFM